MVSFSRLQCRNFRAAQANLNLTVRERRAIDDRARAERKEADAAHRAERAATKRAHLAYLRAERDELRRNIAALPAIEADIRADSFYADPALLQGALDELDSMMNHYQSRLARIESDLRRAG